MKLSFGFTIKHKEGKFNNRIINDGLMWILFYFFKVLRLLRIAKYVYVGTEWNKNSLYDRGEGDKDQADWRKLFGSKSGKDTESNHEEIAVYAHEIFRDSDRLALAKVNLARYIRKPYKGFEVDKPFKEYIVFPNKKAIGLTRIELKYLFPVTPWAGGDKLPVTNYSFKMKLIVFLWEKR